MINSELLYCPNGCNYEEVVNYMNQQPLEEQIFGFNVARDFYAWRQIFIRALGAVNKETHKLLRIDYAAKGHYPRICQGTERRCESEISHLQLIFQYAPHRPSLFKVFYCKECFIYEINLYLSSILENFQTILQVKEGFLTWLAYTNQE